VLYNRTPLFELKISGIIPILLKIENREI
jgi:hypothetical protein